MSLVRLAPALLLAACAAGGGDPVRASNVSASPAASRMPSSPSISRALPPLDLRAPAHLETATFALG